MIVPVMAISNLVLTQQIYSEETNGAHAHYREPVPLIKPKLYCFFIACENIRFYSLFAAGEVSRGETDVYFSRVFRTSEDCPLAGVFKGVRILFLPTAVFYIKVRLIYKLCCYFMNFCKSKSSNLLVSMYQNTAAGRDEIRAP